MSPIEQNPIEHRNLVKLNAWCNTNMLTINSLKTKFMLFAKPSNLSTYKDVNLFIGTSKIESCTYYDYLGIRLDPQLSFGPHIDNEVKTATQYFGH